MSETAEERIKQYLETWESRGRPKNEPEFIEPFIEIIESASVENWHFDGEDYYCGWTAVCSDNLLYPVDLSAPGFEFAYSDDFVKVFTDRHKGFWAPEYIKLDTADDYGKKILDVLHKKFIEWGGF